MDPVYAQFVERYGPIGLVIVAVITGLLVTRKHHEDVVALLKERIATLTDQITTLKDQVADLIRQRDELTRDRDRLKAMLDTVLASAEALTRQGGGDDR